LGKKRGSFNLDNHRRQTEVRLILIGLSILIVVGGSLVWWIYGPAAAITAVTCLLATGGIIGLLWLILKLLERWVGEEEP
jgi:hypothetical protein